MTGPTTGPTTGVTGPGGITLTSHDGIGEITAGTDLAALLLEAYEVLDGDVLVVTSKVLSKAEGLTRQGTREDWLPSETVRVVARRGATRIVRNHLGLTMAAAGIDSSNVASGTVVLLPRDPDGSARTLREQVLARSGANVAVVVTDTAGRAWRDGQTDIAIGAAGLVVAESFAGQVDEHGNDLVVTMPAVADEIAGAAELVQGKLGGRPTALLRGRPDLVLPAGDHGPGAGSLVRPEGADLFGYGSREAVLQALRGRPEDRAPFGAPVPLSEVVAEVARLTEGEVTVVSDPAADSAARLALGPGPGPRDPVSLRTWCAVLGWQVEDLLLHETAPDTPRAHSVVAEVTVSPFFP